MSAGGKVAAGSEVRRRMYFAASRLRGSGCLPRFLASLSRRFCSACRLFRVLASDNEAQDQRLRWRSPRHAFVDTNLHLAFLLGLSGKRCKEIKRLAVRLQQAQRVPAGPHDEVCTGVDHRPQIARSSHSSDQPARYRPAGR